MFTFGNYRLTEPKEKGQNYGLEIPTADFGFKDCVSQMTTNLKSRYIDQYYHDEVKDLDKRIVVVFLPNLNKEDISVQQNNDNIKIDANIKYDANTDEENNVGKPERSYQYNLSFNVAEHYKIDSGYPKYKDNMLMISFTKIDIVKEEKDGLKIY